MIIVFVVLMRYAAAPLIWICFLLTLLLVLALTAFSWFRSTPLALILF
jgi:hypothetical protein